MSVLLSQVDEVHNSGKSKALSNKVIAEQVYTYIANLLTDGLKSLYQTLV